MERQRRGPRRRGSPGRRGPRPVARRDVHGRPRRGGAARRPGAARGPGRAARRGPRRHGLQLRRRPARPPGGGCCRRSFRRCATCAASARRRSTSPGWRAAAWTDTSSAASTPGTGLRDGLSSPRPAAWSRSCEPREEDPLGCIAAPPALIGPLRALVDERARVTSAAAGPVRLWEVDAARTAAIAMMVVYHVGYDVSLFGPSVDIDPFSGGWRALQLACGSSFLFVVGVSLAISNARGRARGLAGWPLYRRHLRRAGEVAAAALLVTLVTWIALGDDYVRFGILHCIAVAMVVGPLLLPLGPVNLILAWVVLLGGMALLRGPASDIPGLLRRRGAGRGRRGRRLVPAAALAGAGPRGARRRAGPLPGRRARALGAAAAHAAVGSRSGRARPPRPPHLPRAPADPDAPGARRPRDRGASRSAWTSSGSAPRSPGPGPRRCRRGPPGPRPPGPCRR